MLLGWTWHGADCVLLYEQLESLKLFPYRAASRLWGEVHDKELYVRLKLACLSFPNRLIDTRK